MIINAPKIKQEKGFNSAKEIALTIKKGFMRRAAVDDKPTNYCGYRRNDGRMFVIGDSKDDIQNPDMIIDNKPAREIFGDFTVLTKQEDVRWQ